MTKQLNRPICAGDKMTFRDTFKDVWQQYHLKDLDRDTMLRVMQIKMLEKHPGDYNLDWDYTKHEIIIKFDNPSDETWWHLKNG